MDFLALLLLSHWKLCGHNLGTQDFTQWIDDGAILVSGFRTWLIFSIFAQKNTPLECNPYPRRVFGRLPPERPWGGHEPDP